MHVGSLYGIAATVLMDLVSPVAGLSNTSPFVLLSESQSLRTGVDSDLGPVVPTMNNALGSIAGDAARTCNYDAYIFVKHPNVSERDVNGRTMPWLTHAAKKVRESVIIAAVLDGSRAEVDQTCLDLQQEIAKNCGAEQVHIDASTGSFEHYADTKARIMSVDFSDSGKSASEVDTLMRNLVGHLPSANFLLAYRTTPVQTKSSSEQQPEQSGKQLDEQPEAHPDAHPDAHSDAYPLTANDVPYQSVFRNYQFFSPGIFMGLIASGTALVVFLIALRAVNSLQISLAAFEPRRQTAPSKSG